MDFIQTANKQVDKFGSGKHGFSAGNQTAGLLATSLSEVWCDGVQQELINVIEASGQVPSGAALNQVLKSVKRLFGGNVKTVSENVSLTADDAGLVLVDASAGNVTVTLPPVNSIGPSSLIYELVRIDGTANVVTVARAGTDTFVGGATSFTLDEQADYRSVRGNGTGTWAPTGVRNRQMPGEVAYFATSTAPTGFLKANGAAVSRTTYAKLFAAIGTTFGAGNGSTTFNLPDLRGEFLRGWDDSRGVDAGRSLGSWQADELKSHNHRMLWNWYDGGGGTGLVDPVNPVDVTYAGQTGGNASWGNTFSGGSETRPRNTALLACIKY